METKIKDPNAPATKRQLWALFCITKQDYRFVKITYGEASKMIADANLSKGDHDFEEYFMSDETIDKLLKKLQGELGMKSVVMNDTTLLPDDGKRYLFLGGGCGFSFIKHDKRSTLGKSIMKKFGKLRPKFEKKLLSKLDKDYLKSLSASGNPIQAHLMQNLSYNTALNSVVSSYMEAKGVKGVSVSSNLD